MCRRVDDRFILRIVRSDRLVVVGERPSLLSKPKQNEPRRSLTDSLVTKGPRWGPLLDGKESRQGDGIELQRDQLQLKHGVEPLEQRSEARPPCLRQLRPRSPEVDIAKTAQTLQFQPDFHLRQTRASGKAPPPQAPLAKAENDL